MAQWYLQSNTFDTCRAVHRLSVYYWLSNRSRLLYDVYMNQLYIDCT